MKRLTDIKNKEDCLKDLAELKWKEGYKCKRCGSELWWPGRKRFYRRCQRCGYDESPTAGTLFHKLKFGLLKAFRICFILSVRKKGMSSCELSRAFDIQHRFSCRIAYPN